MGQIDHAAIGGKCARPEHGDRVLGRTPSWTEIIPLAWWTSARSYRLSSQVRMDVASPGLGLQLQQDRRRGIRVRERLGQIAFGQRPGFVAVEVEDTHPDRSHLQREGEDRSNAGFQRLRAEGWPQGGGRPRQVSLQHRQTRSGAVDARSLAEAELEFLHQAGPPIGGGEHRARSLSGDPGEADAGDRQRVPAGRDQPDGSDKFDRSVTDFCERYADQNEQDYQAFIETIRNGKLEAVEGV